MKSIFPLSGRPIVVIGPMPCEIDAICAAIAPCEEMTLGGYRFTRGTVSGYPGIAAKSLIGMVNAAVTTTLAIREFEPAAIILQGTSGGHDPARHRYDIILGQRLVELGNFYTPHRGAGEGTRPEDWYAMGEEIMTENGVERFTALFGDGELLAIAEKTPYDDGEKVRGTIGSADIWNKELDRIAHLRRTSGSDAEEMEGFAVAQVCKAFGVPMLNIRIVSNSELYPEEAFLEDTALKCQKYVLDVIRNMIAAR